MKYCIASLILFLSGCATIYKVKKCTVIEGIETCSTAEIRSRREFPSGLQLKYNSQTGDFDFYANKVQNGSNPFEEIGVEVIKKAVNQLSFGEQDK